MDLVDVLIFEARVEFGIWVILLGVKVFALGDAIVRKGPLYVAADKQTKPFWIVLLAAFLALHLVTGERILNLFNLIGTVAALVYILDVRPTLRSMHQH